MIIEIKVKERSDIKTALIENSFSKREISKLLLEKSNLKINGKPYGKDYLLNSGDVLAVELKGEKTQVSPVNLPIETVYEDEYILVVNKPKKLSTIPSRLHQSDNLSARVLNYYLSKNLGCGLHPVNRLDFETCGLVVFAKSGHIHQVLSKTKITKRYKALVRGILTGSGVIDKKIEKINGIKKRVISENGKTAVTEYSVLSHENGNTLINVNLLTGRTHQIRVHLSSIGHPLVGDGLYGTKSEGDNFFLFSYYLEFDCKENGKHYKFEI